ncbi:MAG: InlB B-repeat-containing protein, partial [Clostridiales bacterium]|nr:InlB B-repeat-containing protein [Clostridiales bacterium]
MKKTLVSVLALLFCLGAAFGLTACGKKDDGPPTGGEQPAVQYLITWKNWDGATLSEGNVNAGTVPTYGGTTPTRASTAEYTYTFSGWNPAPVAAAAAAIYTAQYTQTPIGDQPAVEYLITWKNWDGATLSEGNVNAGTVPAYGGTAPTRASTAQYAYTFSGWTPAPVAATAAAVYTAQYTQTVRQYAITWKNWDNSVLATTQVDYGTVPVYSGTPTRASTAQYDYTFSGWDAAPAAVTGAATYTAQFGQTVRRYTLTFNANGGSATAALTVDYGTQLAKPANPTKQGYHFVAWCEDAALNTPVVWPLTLTGATTVYAKWNEAVAYGQYLEALLNGYEVSPLSFIPEKMRQGANLVPKAATEPDFASFVAVSAIPYGGYGEQWNMVIDNLEQSQLFFTVLSIVDTLSSASVLAFNNWLDSNPADTSSYEFAQGIYNVTIRFASNVMTYILDYTATVPVLGEQTVQIALTYNILTQEKTGRVQLGDANAIKYVSGENSYELAVRYLGVRRAFLTIERKGSAVEGQIFEYLGVGPAQLASAAQFFITDTYASVVGNKAGGMVGWSGYINELYSVSTGKLLGYEVR